MTDWSEHNTVEKLTAQQQGPPIADQIRFDVSGMKFVREKTYRCLQCRDTGWAEIFHPHAIKAAIADPDNAPWWMTCVISCTCESAEQHATCYSPRLQGIKAGKPLPVFGEARWHISIHDPEAKVKAATYVHRPDNYVDDFSRFEQ